MTKATVKTAEQIFREFYTEAMKIDVTPKGWIRMYVEYPDPDPNKVPILYNEWTRVVYKLHAHHVVIAYNPINVKPVTEEEVRQLYNTYNKPIATIDLFDRVMKDDSMRITPHYGKPLLEPVYQEPIKYETVEDIMDRLKIEEAKEKEEKRNKKRKILSVFINLFNFITLK